MLIIGERINSTREKVKEAVRARDISFILKEARLQRENGAHYIDVNCAVTSADEVEDMEWIVSVVQGGMKDINLCIDSPNHLAIERALAAYKAKGSLMVNSISGDEERIENILPLALKYKAKVIALTMDAKGLPDTADERAEIAGRILARVKKEGLKEEDLYFDPLIRPISTEPGQARETLEAIPMIKKLGNVKIVCGLSNISFGLPARSAINAAFLSMAIGRGLDAAIIDPLDKRTMSAVLASNALMGHDEYCAEYIKAFREGKLAY